jgi:hypothetical protein
MGSEPVKFQGLRDLIAAAGGRRFVMTVGAGFVDTALLVGGYISEQTYLTLTLATVAVYIGAGTYQKTQEMKRVP